MAPAYDPEYAPNGSEPSSPKPTNHLYRFFFFGFTARNSLLHVWADAVWHQAVSRYATCYRTLHSGSVHVWADTVWHYRVGRQGSPLAPFAATAVSDFVPFM